MDIEFPCSLEFTEYLENTDEQVADTKQEKQSQIHHKHCTLLDEVTSR